jgi:hypothetical protein
MSAPELLSVIHTLQRVSAGALRWWDDYDVLVTPTTAGPASPLGEYLRTYVSGRGSAFTREGALVASVAQEGLSRLAPGRPAAR